MHCTVPVPDSDQQHAADLAQARATVNHSGAAELARQPWQHHQQPSSDTDLVRYATWIARDADADPAVLEAGLRLLATARAEIDQCEAALLFAARSCGMTWPQIAEALGLATPQAAQQRLNRVLARLDET